MICTRHTLDKLVKIVVQLCLALNMRQSWLEGAIYFPLFSDVFDPLCSRLVFRHCHIAVDKAKALPPCLMNGRVMAMKFTVNIRAHHEVLPSRTLPQISSYCPFSKEEKCLYWFPFRPWPLYPARIIFHGDFLRNPFIIIGGSVASKPLENTCYMPQRHLTPIVHHCALHNSQEREPAETSINRWVRRSSVVDVYSGILCSVKINDIMTFQGNGCRWNMIMLNKISQF